MTPDEFLSRVTLQPVVVSEGLVNPDTHKVPHTFRSGLLVGPGLSLSYIQAWQENWPSHPLPKDMVELLTQANGIHLWADIAGKSGRSYEGILPLEGWRDVNQTNWAEIVFPSRPDGHLAMSYHADGDAYLALDTRGPTYRYYDLYETEPENLGGTVSELLDW
jgi:hypothetical protein